jgi:hypothetical protein
MNDKAHPNRRPPDKRLPEYFEICDGYACYSPVGVVSLDKAVELITSALIFAREQKIRRLLVDTTQLTGFPNPSVVDRYWSISKWAGVSQCVVEIAFVLQPHLIDPERFGVTVAINRGMRGDVFETKSDALAWLLSGAKPRLMAGNRPENDKSKPPPGR